MQFYLLHVVDVVFTCILLKTCNTCQRFSIDTQNSHVKGDICILQTIICGICMYMLDFGGVDYLKS